MKNLQARIKALLETQKSLTRHRVILWKRCRHIDTAQRNLKKRMKERAKKHPVIFWMMHKGRYTPAARSLAWLMVSTGTAEAKVGSALVEIGNALGVTVNKCMNKCSVQHFILEMGVAADIQVVYEILKSASGSSKFLTKVSPALKSNYQQKKSPIAPTRPLTSTLSTNAVPSHSRLLTIQIQMHNLNGSLEPLVLVHQ